MQASDAHVVAASTVAESPKASSANARRAMCELAERAMPGLNRAGRARRATTRPSKRIAGMREKIKPKELREYRVFSYSRTSLSFILRRLRYAVHRAPRRVSPSSSSAAAGFLDVSRRNSSR